MQQKETFEFTDKKMFTESDFYLKKNKTFKFKLLTCPMNVKIRSWC